MESWSFVTKQDFFKMYFKVYNRIIGLKFQDFHKKNDWQACDTTIQKLMNESSLDTVFVFGQYVITGHNDKSKQRTEARVKVMK